VAGGCRSVAEADVETSAGSVEVLLGGIELKNTSQDASDHAMRWPPETSSSRNLRRPPERSGA
jgi:hypothetical protein